jgi:DNA-binding MarR family transcriptional regulator
MTTNLTAMSDHISDVVEQWRARRPELDLDGMAIFGRIYRLARLSDLERSAALEPDGLNIGDVDVLAALWRHEGGLRPLDLRSAMMVGSGTLTARLDRLERAGFLERHSDPDDRRGRILHITPAGRQVLPDLVERLLEIENAFLDGLPKKIRERLTTDLERLLRHVEGRATPG